MWRCRRKEKNLCVDIWMLSLELECTRAPKKNAKTGNITYACYKTKNTSIKWRCRRSEKNLCVEIWMLSLDKECARAPQINPKTGNITYAW